MAQQRSRAQTAVVAAAARCCFGCSGPLSDSSPCFLRLFDVAAVGDNDGVVVEDDDDDDAGCGCGVVVAEVGAGDVDNDGGDAGRAT